MTKVEKKFIVATVVSTSMDKALTVDILRFKKNKTYGKRFKVNNRIKAECKDASIVVGDIVRIVACRPGSKDIHYKVIGRAEK